MVPRRSLIGREPAITTGWSPYSRAGSISSCAGSASTRAHGRPDDRPATAARSLVRVAPILCAVTAVTAVALPPLDIGARTARQPTTSSRPAVSDNAQPLVEGSAVEPGVIRPVAEASAPAPARSPRERRPPAVRPYTTAEVQALIRAHASAHGIDPELPLAIAACESGFRWNAANGRSSARGVFQYLSGTWRSTEEGRKGASPLDAEANIRMAVSTIATSGTTPWMASRRCWAEARGDRVSS